MDRMTERERYRTIGLWFNGPGASYEQAIENFEKLVAQYPADRAGHINLAFAYFQLLDFPKAMDHGRRAVELYPKNPRSRQNYALYAMYAGDLKTAEAEARTVLEQSKGQYKAYLPLAAVAFASSDSRRMRDRRTRACGEPARPGPRWRPTGWRISPCTKADGSRQRPCSRMASRPTTKARNAVSQASKLIALAEVHLVQNRRAPGRTRGAGRDIAQQAGRDRRSCSPRAPPRQPARRGRRPSRQSSGRSCNRAVAHMAPSSRVRLREPPAVGARQETRSGALRGWLTSGSGGSCWA